MTVIAVLQSLAPVLWTKGIGSDLMKPIAAPIEGFMITSTIHALIMVPVFFALINVSALRHGTLESSTGHSAPQCWKLQICRGFRFGTDPMLQRLSEPPARLAPYSMKAPEDLLSNDRSSFDVHPESQRS